MRDVIGGAGRNSSGMQSVVPLTISACVQPRSWSTEARSRIPSVAHGRFSDKASIYGFKVHILRRTNGSVTLENQLRVMSYRADGLAMLPQTAAAGLSSANNKDHTFLHSYPREPSLLEK